MLWPLIAKKLDRLGRALDGQACGLPPQNVFTEVMQRIALELTRKCWLTECVPLMRPMHSASSAGGFNGRCGSALFRSCWRHRRRRR